jgi:hypothetical protein
MLSSTLSRMVLRRGFFSSPVRLGKTPYGDGVYEHPDGSPVDITDCYANGTGQVREIL